jgi:hypothetical protein
MRLWQAPARALPVTARPVGGETVVSYARRLSVANDLPPTTVLRALGQLTGKNSGKHLLICDARLNEQAAARLEAYTGIPGARLTRALPALSAYNQRTLPQDRPALCFLRAYPRPACRRCELAASGLSGPDILIVPGWTRMTCRRHRRWLGLSGETVQHDLSPARDILAADRRLAGLLARSGITWAWGEFITAWNIAQDWTERPPWPMPSFSRRWRTRAAALGITQAGKQPPRIVTFPEAVTLAGLLTNLDWRRDVALAWADTPFYKHAAKAIGEPSYSPWTLLNDPFRQWIRYHRARFDQVRHSPWGWVLPPPAQDFR